MTTDTVRGAPRRELGWQLLAGLVVGVLAFQVIHVLEHVLQTAYWVLHPAAPPWLTPWASVGRDALAAAVDGHPVSGNEVLHLGGNVLFLVGLVGLVALLHHRQVEVSRLMAIAVWVQGLHVLEHVALTATWFVAGRVIGVTTLFGTVGGTTVSSLRVWAHLLLNLSATGCFLVALSAVPRQAVLGGRISSRSAR